MGHGGVQVTRRAALPTAPRRPRGAARGDHAAMGHGSVNDGQKDNILRYGDIVELEYRVIGGEHLGARPPGFPDVPDIILSPHPGPKRDEPYTSRWQAFLPMCFQRAKRTAVALPK